MEAIKNKATARKIILEVQSGGWANHKIVSS